MSATTLLPRSGADRVISADPGGVMPRNVSGPSLKPNVPRFRVSPEEARREIERRHNTSGE